jgi:hypothetical protein
MGEYREYTDEDLANAVLILQEVLMAKMWEYMKEKNFSKEQREQLAEELGSSLHQTVLLFTGVDLKKVYKKYNI